MKRAIVGLLFFGCAAPPRVPPRPVQPFGTRSIVRGRHGMVASSHPTASRVGVEILQKGGSAADAAIAMNATLGAVEPMMCGPGGDLFAIVWDARTGSLHGLNASGRCPRGLVPDKVPAQPDGTLSPHSPFA